MIRYKVLEVNLGKNEYISFELFEIWVLNFSVEEKTMRNIYNQNVTKLAQYLIVP